MPDPAADDPAAVTYPGAVAPSRTGRIDAAGVGIATYEWGEEDAPPLFLAHGGFDFARTFDLLAPRLAAGGWRVVAWDQRGHGDSERAALYSWEADLRDAVAVMSAITDRPAPVAAGPCRVCAQAPPAGGRSRCGHRCEQSVDICRFLGTNEESCG